MTLRHLAAGDRINYGDLLFAHIFKHYFESDFKIKYYGIVESDYSNFGALPTSSYKSLLSDMDYENDYIIVGGGEVLLPLWTTLYAFINPTYSSLMKNRVLKKIESIINISSFLLQGSGDNQFPMVPNNCNSIYLTSGGQISDTLSSKKLNYVKKNLSKAKFLSVRDQRTKDSLDSHDISSELIPDNAILMSKIYSLEVLESEIVNKELIDINFDYIFLQVGKNKGPKDLVEFQKNINLIAKNKNLKVICCPIGLAPGHEDDIVLKQLCELDNSWTYIEPINLFEIMYLIARSNLYVGTSLHGLITAFCYLVPTFLINSDLVKVNNFVKTWCNDFYKGAISYNKIGDNIDEVLNFWDKSKAEIALKKCQGLVENYFEKIHESLKK